MNADGSLDNTFGTNGIVIYDPFEKLDSSFVYTSKEGSERKLSPNPYLDSMMYTLNYFKNFNASHGNYILIKGQEIKEEKNQVIVTIKLGIKPHTYFYIMCYGTIDWDSKAFDQYPSLEKNILYILLNSNL